MSGNIASEWDGFAASKVYKYYRPLSASQEINGDYTQTVAGSTEEWVPGENCPDGYEFADKSTVTATSNLPNTARDMDEVFKDDAKTPRDLKGTAKDNVKWHSDVRNDIDSAPDESWYDNNKWYINTRWDLKSQLEDMKKKKVKKRYRKLKRSKVPDWLDKVYSR